MKILALLISLTLLVVTHELGHFFFARLFKTRVRRFYVFFNPWFSILKAKKFGGKWHFLFFNSETPDEWDEKNLAPEDQDNTMWGIGWLPLGGYCDIAGMIDETTGADDLESEPQPWEYRTKKPWQRLCIISGGVLVNFLSALLIYTCIFTHWGKDELPMQNAALGYNYHELLLDQGFQNGDIIYAIDGKEMSNITKTQHTLLLDNPSIVTVRRQVTVFDAIFADGTDSLVAVNSHTEERMVDIALRYNLLEKMNPRDTNMLFEIRSPFVVKEFGPGSNAKKAGMQVGDSVVGVAGKRMSCYSDISPELSSHANEDIYIAFYRDGMLDSVLCSVNGAGKIGVQLCTPLEVFECNHFEYNFFQAIPVGISYGWNQLITYARSLKILFTPDGYKGLGGFGTLGSLFPETWEWYSFWNITAFLAIILAFMNVIPIPGLDGGHILFTLWEIITRRKPSDKFLGVAQTIGMILLIGLLLIANGNDIINLFR